MDHSPDDIAFLKEWQSSHFPDGGVPSADATGSALQFMSEMREKGLKDPEIRDAVNVIGNFATRNFKDKGLAATALESSFQMYSKVRSRGADHETSLSATGMGNPNQYRRELSPAPGEMPMAPVVPRGGTFSL